MSAVPWFLAAAALLGVGLLVRRYRRLIEQDREREARGRLALMRVAEPPEDAVAMLARWHAEGQAARDKFLTEGIEKILTEADRRD